MAQLQMSFHLPAAYRLDDDTGMFVGFCPTLKIASQGATRTEAALALRSAITLFLTHCSKRGILDYALTKLGLVHSDHPTADRAAGEIKVGDLPANYSDQSVIEIPLMLIAADQAARDGRESWPS